MLKQILKFFGKENQKIKLLEELDELIDSTHTYLQFPSKARFKNVLCELVDVTVILVQIGIAEGLRPLEFPLLFMKQYRYKVKRTDKIIKQCRSIDDYDRIRYKQ